jgi:hypothetical protein
MLFDLLFSGKVVNMGNVHNSIIIIKCDDNVITTIVNEIELLAPDLVTADSEGYRHCAYGRYVLKS